MKERGGSRKGLCLYLQIWATSVILMSPRGCEGFSPVRLLQSSRPVQQQHQFHQQHRVVALFMSDRNGGNRANRGRVVENRPPLNEEVPNCELRVLTPNSKGKDEPLGIMSRDEALTKAREMGDLDLILVNPSSVPPVCRIADYSKYRYMQEKKAKEVKKASKATEIKEVKMSYKIDVHDYEVRKKNAMKFLTQGNRVKCSVMFRGREVQHDRLGFELLEKLAGDMDKLCVREGKPKREGRMLAMIVSPRPELLKKVNEIRRAEEKAKKKKKTEAKEQRAAAAAAAAGTAGATFAAEMNGVVNGSSSNVGVSMETDDDDFEDDDDEDDDDDDLDLDDDSSLADLFGSDDLSDDLFGL